MKKIILGIASIFVVFSGLLIVPTSLVHAQSPNSLQVDTRIESAINVGCSNDVNPFSSTCLLYAFYNIILEPSFTLVGLAANILDFFLGYSLDSNAYNSLFIKKGWGLIRDISNIAFIFTLLYLAIRHILGLGGIKKYLPTLIIVALLLNFSLFFTKVVIDAGNILARSFYKSIVINNNQATVSEDSYKSITFGLVDKINPQKLLSTSMFNIGNSLNCDYSTETGQCLDGATPNISDRTGTIFTIFILMVIVNLVLAWTFLSVGLLFVGRVIGLWFSMIFSPIAFITLAVPGSGGFLKQLSFDTWKDTVLKLAFVAPVFIFFLYLTISFLDVIFASGSNVTVESGDMFTGLMKIFIPFIFIVILLQVAKKTAESMAGEFGSAVKGLVGKVAGVVGGAALGATAFAGRRVIGGAASTVLNNGRVEARIAKAEEDVKAGKAGAKLKLRSLQASQLALQKWKSSSWDIRNADKSTLLWGGVGKASGALGKNVVRPGLQSFTSKDFNLGKGSKESRAKFIDDEEKKKLKRGEDLSTVRFNERDGLVNSYKEKSNAEIQELKDTKVSIEKGFEDETKTLSERLKELANKPASGFNKITLDEIEEKERITEELNTKEVEKKEKLSSLNEKIKSKSETLEKSASDIVKEEVNRRKNLFSEDVKGQDMWGMMMGVDNKEFAHSIRSGKASKTDEEKLKDIVEKMGKKDDEDKSKKTPPTASTPPPTGGTV